VILVLRALGVGDLATGVPAVRALRAAFPGDVLALAAPAWLTPLIALIGGVDRVVPCAGLDDPLPPLTGVTHAVNLHGKGPHSHQKLAGVRPGALWGYADRLSPDGPAWRAEEHEVRRWCRMLRCYGVPTDDLDLDLGVPAVDVPRGMTIVHPGAKSPSRRWPPGRYAEVARELTAAGHRVLVTGSAAEHGLAARIAEEAGLGADAAPRTGLAELAGLIAHARLLISGDTGVAHLATAFGTPSVTLFGPQPPSRWGPPPDRPRHRVIWHGTRAERGDSPGPEVHPALLAVTVTEVLAAAHPHGAFRS
jgi:ADP-heptose:LPS heptosyltransferase